MPCVRANSDHNHNHAARLQTRTVTYDVNLASAVRLPSHHHRAQRGCRSKTSRAPCGGGDELVTPENKQAKPTGLFFTGAGRATRHAIGRNVDKKKCANSKSRTETRLSYDRGSGVRCLTDTNESSLTDRYEYHKPPTPSHQARAAMYFSQTVSSLVCECRAADGTDGYHLKLGAGRIPDERTRARTDRQICFSDWFERFFSRGAAGE